MCQNLTLCYLFNTSTSTENSPNWPFWTACSVSRNALTRLMWIWYNFFSNIHPIFIQCSPYFLIHQYQNVLLQYYLLLHTIIYIYISIKETHNKWGKLSNRLPLEWVESVGYSVSVLVLVEMIFSFVSCRNYCPCYSF